MFLSEEATVNIKQKQWPTHSTYSETSTRSNAYESLCHDECGSETLDPKTLKQPRAN